ncbi:MAG TPA: Fur family transcriptional regulator [Bdellovibrionota bacterium]|nr:Fur family transcriptional regulator [Bdellovibrionota bacterium]
MNSKFQNISVEEIERRLKDAGVNPTTQRIAIFKYILCDADHPTADQIKSWADQSFPKVSLATIYNTLNVLVDAGLLRELHLPESDSVVYDKTLSEHHHFLDQQTGHLIDIEGDQIRVELKLKRQLKISEMDILLRGTQN